MSRKKQQRRTQRASRPANSHNITVSQRVSISDVVGSGGFQVVLFPALPSNTTWLHNVSSQYSRFRYRNASVEFISHIGTATQGQVSMAWSYDEADPAPTSMNEIQQMGGSLTRTLYSTGKRSICRANIRRQLPSYRYITMDQFNGLSSFSKNDYCPFTFWMATDTTIQGQQIGTLFFTFNITLIDPVFERTNQDVQSLPQPSALGLQFQAPMDHGWTAEDISDYSASPIEKPKGKDQPELTPAERAHAAMHGYFCKRSTCRWHQSDINYFRR